MKKTIGIFVRNAREARLMTREALAKKLKVSTVYVSHIENENPAANVSDRLIEGLHKYLGVPTKTVSEFAKRHNARVTRYMRARRIAKAA